MRNSLGVMQGKTRSMIVSPIGFKLTSEPTPLLIIIYFAFFKTTKWVAEKKHASKPENYLTTLGKFRYDYFFFTIKCFSV